MIMTTKVVQIGMIITRDHRGQWDIHDYDDESGTNWDDHHEGVIMDSGLFIIITTPVVQIGMIIMMGPSWTVGYS